MEQIAEPIPRNILMGELSKARFVRNTNKGGNLIYDFSAREAPVLMQEVGRLRELAFRMAGGGTGLAVDIDAWDESDIPFRQLIVWDPKIRKSLVVTGTFCVRISLRTRRASSTSPLPICFISLMSS